MPSSSTNPVVQHKLTIIGAGILAADGSARLQQCLEQSGQLFCIEPLEMFRQRFPDHAGKCVSLDAVFDELGDNRTLALLRVAETIIERCKTHVESAFILGGHPCVAVKPVQHVLRLRPDWLAIDVVPGVSSVDWMMADLGIDPIESGLQIVAGERAGQLTSALPVAVLSPGYAQSVALVDRMQALARLVQNLRACYGGDAQFIVYTRNPEGFHARRIPVCDLVGLATTPYLGNKLVLGPVALLPSLTHTPHEPG